MTNHKGSKLKDTQSYLDCVVGWKLPQLNIQIETPIWLEVITSLNDSSWVWKWSEGMTLKLTPNSQVLKKVKEKEVGVTHTLKNYILVISLHIPYYPLYVICLIIFESFETSLTSSFILGLCFISNVPLNAYSFTKLDK